MRIEFLTLVVMAWCAYRRVLGQFPNGITFSGANIPSPTPTVQTPAPTPLIIVPENCTCVFTGSCPSQAPTIDIRIVNNGGAICPPNYQLCCSTTTTTPKPNPPIQDGCGIRKIAPTSQPVVGQASFGAYPWQAALLTLQQAYIGSGVLLDATHVLTAAHKVASYANNPASMLVRLGEWNAIATTEPYQFVQVAVAKITVHPNFNSATLENDVAVIRLNGVVPIASYPNVNTACKPTALPAVGTRCYVAGWGKNLFGSSGSYQSILREVDVPIVDYADCENRLRTTRLGTGYILNRVSFLCAGGESGKDACTGDGGSPLVCPGANGQWTVVGLVAWGIGCANTGVPGVYTNVFNFLPWINNAIATA